MLRLLSFFLIFTTIIIAKPVGVLANNLVFLEVYLAPGCKDNTKLIEDLWQMKENDPDVIIMNCNVALETVKDPVNQNKIACVDRRVHFSRLLGFDGNQSKALVNGLLDASLNDVNAAVKAGRSLYDVERISLERKGETLHITVPDLDAGVETGELFLHVYAPSEKNSHLIVDADVNMTKEIQEKLKNKMSVPYVTETQIKPPKFREVMGQERIGLWQEGQKSISIPLSRFKFYGYSLDDVGYIVSLHEGEDYGAVLAAGEIKPDTEAKMSMPEDQIIEQISYPPKNPVRPEPVPKPDVN